MLIYYLYTHTRLDTNQIFYVGIGKSFNDFNFERSKTTSKRSKEWKQIYNECNCKIKIDIVSKFDNHDDCCKAEISLIKYYGRQINNTGYLVNKAPGGHKWKDVKIIYQYTLNGEYLRSWNDIKEVSNYLKISASSIYKAANIEGRSSGNYLFKWFKTDKIEPYIQYKNLIKKIYQFSKTGEFIKSYNSITEAYKNNKLYRNSFKNINKNKPCIAGNYYWSFDRYKCYIKRIIYQYKDDKLINKYSSLPEAAKALGKKSVNSIDNALKKKVQLKAYGYTWVSKENFILDLYES